MLEISVLFKSNPHRSISVNYSRGYRLRWNTMSHTVLEIRTDIVRYDRHPLFSSCLFSPANLLSKSFIRHYQYHAIYLHHVRFVRYIHCTGILYDSINPSPCESATRSFTSRFPSENSSQLIIFFFFSNISSSHWILRPLTRPVVDSLVYTIYCSPLLYLLHRRFPISTWNIAPKIFRHGLFSNVFNSAYTTVVIVRALYRYIRVGLVIIIYNWTFDLLDNFIELKNFFGA